MECQEILMKNDNKNNEQLLKEIGDLKTKITELEKSDAKHKLAEDALESSEEKFKILFESAPDAYFLSDLKGTFIDGNKAAENLIGYKKDELIGKNYLNLKILSAKEILKASKLLVKNFQGKGTGPDEFVLNRKDKSHVWAEIITFPVKIKDKTVILGIARDITDRKKTDEEIIKAKEIAELYLDMAGSMILSLNSQGEITMINQKGLEILEYSREELIGKNWFDNCIPKEKVQQVKNVFHQIFVGKIENLEHYDNEVITKAGKKKLISWYNSVIKDEKDEIDVIISSGQDITEKKHAEVALKESEEKLRLMIDNSHIGFSSTDLNGNFIDVNPAMCDMIGYSQNEMKNKHFDQFSHPNDKAKNNDLYQKLVAGEIPYFDLQKRYVHKNGKIIHVLIRAQIVHDAEGNPLFEFAITEDITDREKAVKALQKSEQRYRILFEKSPIPLWEQDYTDIIRHFEDLKKSGISDFEEYFTKNSGELFKCADLIKNKDVNDAAIRLFKASSKEELIKSINNVFTENTIPVFKKSLLSIAKGKKSFESEVILQTLKSEELVCILKWSLSGTIVVTSTQDITESKHANEILLKMDRAINNSGEVIFMTDIEGTITYINLEFTKMYGYTAEEVVGKTTPRILKSGFLTTDQMEQLWSALLNKQNLPVTQYVNKCKSGKLIDIEGSADPILDDNGDIIGFLGIQRNITDRKKAEEKINLLSNIVKQSTEGMAQADLNGNLVFINNAWCEMHGYKSYKELLGKNLAIFHNKEQAENDVIPFNDKVMKNGTYSGEVGHITKDGEPFPTLMTTTVLKDDKGKPYGIAAIAKDITERKLEEQIQSVIYHISRAINTTDTLDELYKIIHQQLGNILNVTNFYIANYEEETGEIFASYFISDNVEIKIPHKFRNNGVTNYIIKNTKSLFLTEELRKELIDQGEIANYKWSSKALLGVPLKIGEKIIGCIVVRSSKEESSYTKKDLSILEFISSQVAISIAHKQAERALIESEQLSSAVIKDSPLGISVRDKYGTLILNNETWKKIWGFTDEQVESYKIKRTKLQMNNKDGYLGKHQENIRNVYENGGSYFVSEMKLIHDRNNKAEWIMQRFYAIMNEAKKVEKVVILTEDITERKQAEEMLKKKIKELEIFNEATVDREIMINESRKEINELLIKLGEEPKYEIVE